MTTVKGFRLDSPSHHYHRQKHLTPALSTLLSSTTIPCSRNKHKHQRLKPTPDSFAFSLPSSTTELLEEVTLNFAKKEVSSPPRQVKSGLGNGLVREILPIQVEHDLFDISTPLWEDPEQDDDGSSTASSFSSIGSSLSSPGTSFSSSKVKRRSLSILASGHRVVCPLEFSSVDEQSHPLADVELLEKEEEEEAPAKKSFMSQFTASLKAFTSVASSLSSSQRSLLSSSNDVFAFSPRSTDEPIPVTRVMSMPPVRPSKPLKEVKIIALETYSIQEYSLPTPPRHRDIRENPDFLRIYALEILMRKNGKLSSGFSGKAQVALLPRLDEVPRERYSRFPKYQRPVVREGKQMIPVRWVGINAY